MNPIDKLILKSLRKAYQKLFVPAPQPYDRGITDPDEASKVIYDMLASGKPCMIARYGAFELATIVNYLGVTSSHPSAWKFIRGQQPQWWWNRNLMRYMQTNAGFFPATEENLSRFCEMMLEDSKQLDMLGSWLRDENQLESFLPPSLIRIDRDTINPFFSRNPWTRVLEGKKVVIVHPFTHSILSQYERINKVFNNNLMPSFDIRTVKAVQSLGGQCNQFTTWFEALDWMKNEIDSQPYDIALLGCGAYGFPLAAHIKRTGHQAVHLGGSLQLYFGIKGKRWEGKGYAGATNDYTKLFNEYWIRPSSEETPSLSSIVEGGCYW